MRVLLTFDIDAESVQVRETPDRPTALSRGQFARVGVERILGLLERHGIRSTFFTPAWTAQAYPEMIRGIAKRGHEIAAHGNLHENLAELDDAAEEDVHAISVRALERVVGRRPIGFRAPYYEWSSRTLAALRRHGFRYDSSLMNDDRPYPIEEGSKPFLVELPVDWSLEDWPQFEELHQPPSTVLESWKTEFDARYDLGVDYFILTMHPECVGRAARLRMVEQIVEHMESRRGTVFVTCETLVEYLRTAKRSR